MAIEKTIELQEIKITKNRDGEWSIYTSHKITLDDPSDDQLPMTSQRNESVMRTDSEGNVIDHSDKDQLVQDIAAVVWA